MKTHHQMYYDQQSKTFGRKDKLGNDIEFRLTFEEWDEVWTASGKIDLRGTHRGQYVMSRYGDIGHYEVGNVFIQLCTDNIAFAQKGRPKSTNEIANLTEAANRPEVKLAKSIALTGRIQSKEEIENRRISNTGLKRTQAQNEANSARLMERVKCPHCDVQGTIRIMKRWHFDNCKFS